MTDDIEALKKMLPGYLEKVERLISEMEKLKEENDYYHSIEYAGRLQKQMLEQRRQAAARCVEIVETEKVGANEHDCSSDQSIDMTCDSIAANIQREFSL